MPRPLLATTLGLLLLAASACRTAPRPDATLATAAPERAGSAVYLVRHAERADVAGNDPPLSEAGRERALALREALAAVKVGAIVVSDRRRTAETAEPLARALGMAPIVVPIGAGVEAHVAAVVETVRRERAAGEGAVVVVGHSNTIPLIARALGAADAPDICDGEFSHLFVVTERANGGTALGRERYGAADPPGAAGCPQTMGRP